MWPRTRICPTKCRETCRELGQRGFTLLEAILSWVLLGIVFLSFSVLLHLVVEGYRKMEARKEALAQVRFAMDRFYLDMLPVKSADLLSISTSQIQFKDPVGNTTDYHVATSGGSTHLYRGSDILAKNIQTFSLSYYDSLGNLLLNLTDLLSVRRIHVEISAQAAGGFGQVRARGIVYPRNFYYENFH